VEDVGVESLVVCDSDVLYRLFGAKRNEDSMRCCKIG